MRFREVPAAIMFTLISAPSKKDRRASSAPRVSLKDDLKNVLNEFGLWVLVPNHKALRNTNSSRSCADARKTSFEIAISMQAKNVVSHRVTRVQTSYVA